MCGIAVMVNVEGGDIRHLAQGIQHRGPDGLSTTRVENGRVQFAHSLLATLDDPLISKQPMWSASGQFCLVYNGFISNTGELHDELAVHGYRCKTKTDTEAILELYAREGMNCFRRLDGMFAAVLYDRNSGEIVYVRDPLGIKPLFVRKIAGGYAFASEPAPLRALAAAHQDPLAIVEAVMLNYAAGLRTGIHEVERIAPGECGIIQRDGQRRNVDPLRLPVDTGQPVSSKIVWNALGAAVRKHIEGSGPVAISFSSGTDSTSIAALLKGEDVTLLSMACENSTPEERHDDPAVMEQLAKVLGHRFVRLLPPEQTVGSLRAAGAAMGEPFCDFAAVASDVVARGAAALGIRILLSGHGADELFGGYRRHMAARYLLRWAHPPLPLRPLANRDLERLRILAAARTEDRLSLLNCWLSPDRLSEIFSSEFIEAAGGVQGVLGDLRLQQMPERDPLRRLMRSDLERGLPHQMLAYSDRFAMRNGVENRVPFLSREVIAVSRSLPSSRVVRGLTGKPVLKQALRQCIGKRAYGLVAGKRGFGIPITHPLRDRSSHIADVLFGASSSTRHFWNPELKRRMEGRDCRLDSYFPAAMLMIDGWSRH